MKIRLMVVLSVACLLGGCSVWDDSLSWVGLGSDEDNASPAQSAAPSASDYRPAASPSTATLPAGGAEQWCQDVAKSAQETAAKQGFDATSQQHRFEAVYRQCMQYPGWSAR